MAVIVEVLGWGGRSQGHFRVDGPSVTIGRGYQNDVVLDDPYISANHLRLDATENGWQLTDLQSRNGVQVLKNSKTENSSSTVILEDGAEIKVGRRRLRILTDGHPVEPAKELHRLEQDLGRLNRLSIWLPLFLISLALDIGSLYASSFVEWQWKNHIFTILGSQAVVLMVALFWSLLGRFLRHERQFLSQYSLILSVGLIYTLLEWLIGVLSYNLSSSGVAMIMLPLLAMLLATLLLSANFALATNMLPRQRWISALGFVMLVIVVSISGQLSGWGEFSPYPDYFSGLEVPALQFTSAESADDFMTSFDPIFAAADRLALD